MYKIPTINHVKYVLRRLMGHGESHIYIMCRVWISIFLIWLLNKLYLNQLKFDTIWTQSIKLFSLAGSY